MAEFGNVDWTCVCGQVCQIVLTARPGPSVQDVSGYATLVISSDSSSVVNHVRSCQAFGDALAAGADQGDLLCQGLADPQLPADPDSDDPAGYNDSPAGD